MEQTQAYVVIGNGIAGVTAAETLRAANASCKITIVADDPFPVYYRPALKDYLGGGLEEQKLWARPTAFYSEQNIRFAHGRVIGIDRAQHFIQLHNGKRVAYDRLLLANGARPRTLTCPGMNLNGVSTLRTVADYQHILQQLKHVSRVVICGSGTLALESAEILRHRDFEVTHLLRGRTLWSEVLDPIASDIVLEEERRAGIDVRVGEEIAEVVGRPGQGGQEGRVTHVITTSGQRIACEMVLIAIGIDPLIDFVRASGIASGRGVQVDNGMRTSDADIFAAGDVIETTDPHTGRARVLGQWMPAIQQAQVAAYNMLGLLPPQHPFSPGPRRDDSAAWMNYYNATLLCGLDFVSVGSTHLPAAPGYREIVDEPRPRSYRKMLLKQGVIVGAMLLGNRTHALAFKRAIDARVSLASIERQIFADDFDLDAWLDAQHTPAPVLNIQLAPSTSPAAYVEIAGVSSAEYGSALSEHAEVVLVPIPHPRVQVEAAETTIPRQTQSITIGRQPGVSLKLEHGSISRLHAEITGSNGAYMLRDRGSSNGTFVNGTQLVGEQAHQLRNHDRLRFGDVQYRFELRPRATPQPAGITIREQSEEVVAGMAHRRTVRKLGADSVRFEIDMCIGCNRCMEACPIPMSSLVTIADLNTANVTETVASAVARFTHECIMCGSCVPVCPVDNHRDLLMLSLKERLGDSWKKSPDMRRVQQVLDRLPEGWSPQMLILRLREQAILQDSEQVPDTYLLHMLAASELVVVLPGETLLREGEYGRDLYLIVEGRLELTASDIEGNALPVAILRRGEYAGEDGMLTGLPYKATALAQAPTMALRVPEQVMQRLMELVPGVRGHFERYNAARSLRSILKRLALFQGVADRDMLELIRRTPVKEYDRDERLFAEDGQEAQASKPARETMHILLEGFVKVARHTAAGTGQQKSDERILAYRQGGDYFAGGLDLLGDGQAVTVTTINRCRVAEVPRDVLLTLFREYPEVNQRFSARLREYVETAAAAQGYAIASGPLARYAPTTRALNPHVQDGLHSLVSDGVVEGTEVLVIDLDKCIHCDECEEACERRHGHSRMNRKGMVVGNISIATACRQCQDPVCMLCSRAGIARHPNGEVYITESCIGCGICAERCPYGAISIVQIDDETASPFAWERFRDFFSKGTGRERMRAPLPAARAELVGSYTAPGPLDVYTPRHGYDEMRKKVAIKCDLCAGYGDQACVQACPTGAAVRISPVTFFGSTEEILRRRVR